MCEYREYAKKRAFPANFTKIVFSKCMQSELGTTQDEKKPIKKTCVMKIIIFS